MPVAKKPAQGKRLPPKPWSFLVYIAGDNDLSEFGLEDIFEMCETGASPRVHAGVEIDTRGDHTGSIRYEISEPDTTGAAHPIEIQRLPEQDSGAPTTLRRFLTWGLTRYPASRRLVVIWNHGAGFRTARRDIAFDDYGSSLDMNEIEHAMRSSGIGPANKIQVLGFDACLMNMIEVVNHLRGLVEVVVGSEQTEPGDGWPYEKVLAAINTAPTPSVLGSKIVKAYIDDYRGRGDQNVTQSAVSVDATEAAVKALGELGQLLAGRIDTVRAALSRVRIGVQSYEYADFVDLVHLAALIRKAVADAAIKSACQKLIAATRASVLASNKLGPEVADSNGLSVWFPAERSLFLAFRSKYRALHCSQHHPGWVHFLDAFHAQAGRRAGDTAAGHGAARASSAGS